MDGIFHTYVKDVLAHLFIREQDLVGIEGDSLSGVDLWDVGVIGVDFGTQSIGRLGLDTQLGSEESEKACGKEVSSIHKHW